MANPPPYAQNDPSKQNWAGASPYPIQPGYGAGVQPGYPQMGPQPGYPAMGPQPGYPAMGPQPGFNPQGGYPQQGGYGGAQPVPPMGFRPAMDPSAYNATGGGNIYQPGAGNSTEEFKDDSPGPEGFGTSFGDKAIRHAFVRKVYLILMCQLLVTFGTIVLFTFHSGVKRFVHSNMWVVWLSYAVFLVTYLSLVCCSGVRRKSPGNIIMLSIFTIAMSYLTGAISAAYDTNIVLMTVGITAVICFLISLFAMQTKFDFTGCGTYLFVASMVLLIFGIVSIFWRNEVVHMMYSAGIALLFSMYLVYDTQMLMGGRKYELSPEEHIFGALTLYMDIINIFLALLSLNKQ